MPGSTIISKPIILPASSLGLPPLVWPTLPPFPKQGKNKWLGQQVMPVGIKLADEPDYWYIPQEPTVSISGANTIVRRTVAKANGLDKKVRGTVKETWAQDDYSIHIAGVLRNFDNETAYPRNAVERLRFYCEAKEAIVVTCPLFEIFNITQMVIEKYELPHTKCEDLQGYTISAYSDMDFELLI
jgi:hypothetical protein